MKIDKKKLAVIHIVKKEAIKVIESLKNVEAHSPEADHDKESNK